MAGDGGDLDPGAGAGLKPLAGFQVACVQPLVECRNPEGVTVRGGEGFGSGSVGAVRAERDLD
jgi:hypothetical protein